MYSLKANFAYTRHDFEIDCKIILMLDLDYRLRDLDREQTESLMGINDSRMQVDS